MKRYRFLTMLVLICCITIKPALSGSETRSFNGEEMVDTNTAIPTASQYLTRFYTEKWTYYTHFTYYDFDNRPKVYAIVFKKEGLTVEPFEMAAKKIEEKNLSILRLYAEVKELKKNAGISDESANNSISQLREEIIRLKSLIRGADRFATVITGAISTLPAIIKCHRGLPVAFVNKVDVKYSLSSKWKGKQYSINKVYFFGLPDIFYEVVPVGETSSSVTTVSADNDLRLFHLRTGKLVSLSMMRHKFQTAERSLLKEVKEVGHRMDMSGQIDSNQRKVVRSNEKAVKEVENEAK
jgi:hypothetical protein